MDSRTGNLVTEEERKDKTYELLIALHSGGTDPFPARTFHKGEEMIKVFRSLFFNRTESIFFS